MTLIFDEIDWQDIEGRFGAAYSDLVGLDPENQKIVCCNSRPVDYMNEDNLWEDRDLYEFFDSKGILIAIWPPNDSPSKWSFEILSQSPLSARAVCQYDTRESAEKAAFIVAFEGLEWRLRHVLAETSARKILKKGDRVSVTKCPGTKRTFTFDHWDGCWMVSKSGIDDYHPGHIHSVNGLAWKY